ncbi:hypothetical protein KFK09_003141 [Dendrobium nobile]|uniref:Uncharacterized protein n=1 Tax=Dendrobium nobile TaxID=94219 RepID=A0A8T3C3B3_DENNO|nr:hypothetical protein KFK09_003141 [Dendrobium nobile]
MDFNSKALNTQSILFQEFNPNSTKWDKVNGDVDDVILPSMLTNISMKRHCFYKPASNTKSTIA